MSESILVSTHELERAGPIRDAFRASDYSVRLVSGPEDLSQGPDPGALVLTGGWDRGIRALAPWAREVSCPVFILGDGDEAGPVEDGDGGLGPVEVVPASAEPEEVVLLTRKAIQRRRVQEATGIVGESDGMREAMERVVQFASVDSTVLITGESGTGKELVARGLHALSPRRHKAFIAVNVAALSETLLESELFGHEKGAFTGAIDTRKGFFELADKGTIFLDEIGEMPLTTQTKLLRVLEQREFLRVGGERPLRVDVRILTATNQELRSQVALGQFRKDLYYRLNILHVQLPPLRERRGDIPRLVRHFVREVADRMDRPFPGISPEAMEILINHDWPGNVRELRNLVESMVVLAPGREIGPQDIPREIRHPTSRDRLLPVPFSPPAPARAAREEKGTRDDGGRELRPELEFVFRTLVELRVDMDELRRDFEDYRDELEERGRLTEARVPSLGTGRGGGVEVGVLRGGSEICPPTEEPEPSPEEPDEEEESGEVVYRPGMTMEDLEREAILAVLRQTGGNRREAAEVLGIGERTLYRKIRKFDLDV